MFTLYCLQSAMMNLQMIYEKYYSYIRNYEREEGSAFMQKAFNSSIYSISEQDVITGAPQESTPNSNGELDSLSNSPSLLTSFFIIGAEAGT
jgi:hypothetical protein